MKRLAQYFALNFVHQAITAIGGVLITFLIASTYRPSDYGQYVYVVALGSILQVLSLGGLQNLLLRKDTSLSTERDKLAGLILNFFCSLLLIGIILLLLYKFEYLVGWQALILFLCSQISILKIIESYSIKTKKHSPFIILSIAVFVIIFGLKIKVLDQKLDVLTLIILSYVEAMLVFLIFVLMFKKIQIKELDFNLNQIISRYKDAIPFMISGIAIIVYHRSDIVIIKYFLGYETVASYGLASRLVEFGFFIPLILFNHYFKRLKNAENQQFYNEYGKLIWTNLLIALLYFGSVNVLLFLMNYYQFFGELENFVLIGRILSAGIFAVFINVSISRYFIMMGNPKISLFTNIIGAVLNIVGNILIVRIFGAVGVASVTVFVYCSMSIALVVVFWIKARPIPEI